MSESKTLRGQSWGKPSDAQLGIEMYSKPLATADDFQPLENMDQFIMCNLMMYQR